MSEQYPPNQPPYYPPQPPPQPGIGTGFKLMLGAILAIVVLIGGSCVACALLVGGLGGAGAIMSNSNSGSSNSSAPQANQITLDKFNRIYDGEAYSDVCIKLGQPGKLDYSSGTGKNKMENYSWDAGFMKSVSATFQNGKLVSKSQFGLE